MLRARLLGTLKVDLDGAVVDSAAVQRPWAVFAYLALSPRPVSRTELASTFWPDVLDQSARASLRSALWALRRRLGEALAVDGERVWLREAWVDVREFERLATDDPRRALELCHGDLLESIDDDWVVSSREHHRARVIDLLEGLATDSDARGDPRDAIELTRRQVEVDRFDEQAHRRLIERLATAGDRAGAMRVYRVMAERLRRELGVAPSAATRELADQLRVPVPPPGSLAPSASPRAPRQPALLPLVGRDRELAELDSAWRAAAAGQGGVAVIRGEAGIGKTRLAGELRRRAIGSGARAATSAALDLGGQAPFSLWAELIRELLPGLPSPPLEAGWPDDLAVLAPELPEQFARTGIPAIAVAPDLQRTRLFEAIVALLAHGARDAPLLLLLEDLHTADGASLELAGYAARRVAGLRVMMVLTRRSLPHSPDADRLEHALRTRGLLSCEVELGPLEGGEVASLARAAGDLSDSAVAQVVQGAEGNALLAVETARALARGHAGVAPNLRGSVRATIATLPDEGRALVEIAAVAARPLETLELRQLALADPEQGATDALQSGLLEAGDGRLAFRHALLRDAVYQEIADPRRRALHHRWAEAVLAVEQAGGARRPAEVARHLRLAGADQEAVAQLARAAQDARDVAALEAANAFLEEALAIASDRADLWLELGELHAWRGDRAGADAAFAQGLALLAGAEPREQARAWLRRARSYHGPICLPRDVLESARNALELLDRTSLPVDEERSEAIAVCAWSEAVAGSVEEAERLLAELSAQSLAPDDLRTYDAGHARALALMRRGAFADSYGPSIAAGEAIARAGRPDLAYGCWANAANAANAGGERDRALEFLDRGMAAIEGHGLQSIEIHLLAARAFVLRGLGRLAEARRAAEAEQELADRLGQPELEAMAAHDLGLVAVAQEDYVAAAGLLSAALAAERAPISRPLTRLALAEALARAGDADGAAEQVRATVLEPVRPSDFPPTLVPRVARAQGLIAHARGDDAQAERRLREAIGGWERQLERTVRAESITTVLADLGRPVVGLVEPERELAAVRLDLQAIQGALDAVVP